MIQSGLHPHPLADAPVDGVYSRGAWVCDVCDEAGDDGQPWHCFFGCDWDACRRCAWVASLAPGAPVLVRVSAAPERACGAVVEQPLREGLRVRTAAEAGVNVRRRHIFPVSALLAAGGPATRVDAARGEHCWQSAVTGEWASVLDVDVPAADAVAAARWPSPPPLEPAPGQRVVDAALRDCARCGRRDCSPRFAGDDRCARCVWLALLQRELPAIALVDDDGLLRPCRVERLDGGVAVLADGARLPAERLLPRSALGTLPAARRDGPVRAADLLGGDDWAWAREVLWLLVSPPAPTSSTSSRRRRPAASRSRSRSSSRGSTASLASSSSTAYSYSRSATPSPRSDDDRKSDMRKSRPSFFADDELVAGASAGAETESASEDEAPPSGRRSGRRSSSRRHRRGKLSKADKTSIPSDEAFAAEAEAGGLLDFFAPPPEPEPEPAPEPEPTMVDFLDSDMPAPREQERAEAQALGLTRDAQEQEQSGVRRQERQAAEEREEQLRFEEQRKQQLAFRRAQREAARDARDRDRDRRPDSAQRVEQLRERREARGRRKQETEKQPQQPQQQQQQHHARFFVEEEQAQKQPLKQADLFADRSTSAMMPAAAAPAPQLLDGALEGLPPLQPSPAPSSAPKSPLDGLLPLQPAPAPVAQGFSTPTGFSTPMAAAAAPPTGGFGAPPGAAKQRLSLVSGDLPSQPASVDESKLSLDDGNDFFAPPLDDDEEDEKEETEAKGRLIGRIFGAKKQKKKSKLALPQPARQPAPAVRRPKRGGGGGGRGGPGAAGAGAGRGRGRGSADPFEGLALDARRAALEESDDDSDEEDEYAAWEDAADNDDDDDASDDDAPDAPDAPVVDDDKSKKDYDAFHTDHQYDDFNADFDMDDQPTLDDAEFTASAPTAVPRQSFTLRIWASSRSREGRTHVLERIHAAGARERSHPVPLSLERGVPVTVTPQLPAHSFAIRGAPSASFLWTGEPAAGEFRVDCLPGARLGSVEGFCDVVSGKTAAVLHFELRVGREAGEEADLGEQRLAHKRVVGRTFASASAAFEVERELGVGNGGRALLARRRPHPETAGLPERVVLKELHASSAFQHEATLHQLAGCHPNVVETFGFVLGERPSIVTEFCERGSALDELQRRGAAWGTAERAAAARDAGLGLAHLHVMGVLHRDVAARNVLLGGDGVARLTDFGLSVVSHPAAYDGQLVDRAASFGAVRWMAPEQMHGRVSRASDVWSLGCLMYELGAPAGQQPWADAQSHAEVARRVAAKETLDVAGLPAQFREAARACLAWEARKRPTAWGAAGLVDLGG